MSADVSLTQTKLNYLLEWIYIYMYLYIFLYIYIYLYICGWLCPHLKSKIQVFHTENKIICHNVAPPLKDTFKDYFKRRHHKFPQSNFQTALGPFWICSSLVFFTFLVLETFFKTNNNKTQIKTHKTTVYHISLTRKNFSSSEQRWIKSQPAIRNFKRQVTPASSGSY